MGPNICGMFSTSGTKTTFARMGNQLNTLTAFTLVEDISIAEMPAEPAP